MSDQDDIWAKPPEGSPIPSQPNDSPYGKPDYGYPSDQSSYGLTAPKHPQATTALVLGIVGLVGGLLTGIGFVASPFAWVIGAKAVKEIDASPQSYAGRDQAKAGQIMGIIGTVILILFILLIGGLIAALVVFSV